MKPNEHTVANPDLKFSESANQYRNNSLKIFQHTQIEDLSKIIIFSFKIINYEIGIYCYNKFIVFGMYIWTGHNMVYIN